MFKLPIEIIEGLKGYKASLDDFVAGKINAGRFSGVRVPWGIYSHRGGKVFMDRIRIPAGLLNPSQLKAISYVSQKYGNGVAHITTRQDMQVHGVKIEDTAKVMEYLKDYELSSRGGGGNTVRNITSCALSGVCKDEALEIRNHAIALSEHLLKQESSYNLPRKFKVAFSGCNKDCSGVLVNDVGLLAGKDGSKKGFQVFVGGGMGADSRLGKLLEGFLPEDELGYCVEAIKNVFYKNGNRRDKYHNRLRFLIEGLGFDKFVKLYKDELSSLKEKEHIVLRKVTFDETRQDKEYRDNKDREGCDKDREYKDKRGDEGKKKDEDKEYKEFLKYSVQPQKQDGFFTVQLRIPRGDMSVKELSQLSELGDEFKGIEFRTSPDQNLFIAWVAEGDIQKLFLRLKKILKEFLYPQTLLDVVACKGAVTCNLGLCNSPALAAAIEDAVKKDIIGKDVFGKLKIRINGCPNSCGHAPVGQLAFYGMVRRVDNRPVPFYKFIIGGRKAGVDTIFAQEVGQVPARNVPAFLIAFINRCEKLINKDGDVHNFLRREALDIAKEVLSEYSFVPPYSEDRSFYVDWGKTEDFSLSGLGPGECGSGIINMIESDLALARISLDDAQKKGYSPEDIKKVLFLSSRALLVVKGKDPRGEPEAFAEFKTKFIDEGIISKSYEDIASIFKGLNDSIAQEDRKVKFEYAKRLFDDINRLYQSMDSAFNFPKAQNEPEVKKEAGHTLDLKGTPCPINYVKTKLFLENLKTGEILDVLLDEGEPIDNVPKSLEADGQTILNIEKIDKFYKVTVRKNI